MCVLSALRLRAPHYARHSIRPQNAALDLSQQRACFLNSIQSAKFKMAAPADAVASSNETVMSDLQKQLAVAKISLPELSTLAQKGNETVCVCFYLCCDLN